MNLCLKILSLLLLTALSQAQQIKKVDVKLDWHAPAGFETNGIYNIRYLAEGSVTSDWKTWPILSTVTNSVSHLLYNVWETQLFSVTHTNELTGVESVEGISPIYLQAYNRTNEPAPVPQDANTFPDAKDFPDELKPVPPLVDPNPLPPDIEPEPHIAANYFVDFLSGSDTNSGLSTAAPWKTCKPLGPGDTVTFKGGVSYRGSVVANSGATYLGTSAWGSGKAVMEGTTIITNAWVQCTNAADAGGNPNWAKIWRTTIPAGVSNCLPTLICNGTNLCQWSQEPDPSDKIFWEVLSEWRVVSATNISTTWLRDPLNLTQPDGYYDECFAAVWVSGNSTVVVPITNYVQAANTIWFANSTPPYSDRDNYYALINHPQFIDVAGEWAVRRNENRLYLWPIGDGNPNTQELGISRRGSAFTGFVNNVKVSGFAARGYYQPPGENGYNGQFVAMGNSDWITHNVIVTSNDLYFFKSFNSGPIIDIERGSNAVVAWNSIHDSLISRGMLVNGTRGSVVTNNTLYRLNGTGIYFNGATNGLLAGNRVLDIIGIHGNGISVYGNSTNVIVSANVVSNCTSLLTYEQSADITFINNLIDANGKDYRVSEWGGTWGPVRWYNSSLANNPSGNMMSSASGTGPGASFTNINNIISGGGRSNQANNIYTKLAWFQDQSYGWKLGTNESVADASLVYANTNTHDWRPRSNSPAINAGMPLTNLFTTDLSGVVRGASWDIGALESQPQPVVTGLSLSLAWQGPPNWQAQGGIFNLRAATTGSMPTNYATWPVVARVTNILNTTFYNVNPTQWYAISFTNAMLSSESTEGIPPVSGQYTQQ